MNALPFSAALYSGIPLTRPLALFSFPPAATFRPKESTAPLRIEREGERVGTESAKLQTRACGRARKRMKGAQRITKAKNTRYQKAARVCVCVRVGLCTQQKAATSSATRPNNNARQRAVYRQSKGPLHTPAREDAHSAGATKPDSRRVCSKKIRVKVGRPRVRGRSFVRIYIYGKRDTRRARKSRRRGVKKPRKTATSGGSWTCEKIVYGACLCECTAVA